MALLLSWKFLLVWATLILEAVAVLYAVKAYRALPQPYLLGVLALVAAILTHTAIRIVLILSHVGGGAMIWHNSCGQLAIGLIAAGVTVSLYRMLKRLGPHSRG